MAPKGHWVSTFTSVERFLCAHTHKKPADYLDLGLPINKAQQLYDNNDLLRMLLPRTPVSTQTLLPVTRIPVRLVLAHWRKGPVYRFQIGFCIDLRLCNQIMETAAKKGNLDLFWAQLWFVCSVLTQLFCAQTENVNINIEAALHETCDSCIVAISGPKLPRNVSLSSLAVHAGKGSSPWDPGEEQINRAKTSVWG